MPPAATPQGIPPRRRRPAHPAPAGGRAHPAWHDICPEHRRAHPLPSVTLRMRCEDAVAAAVSAEVRSEA